MNELEKAIKEFINKEFEKKVIKVNENRLEIHEGQYMVGLIVSNNNDILVMGLDIEEYEKLEEEIKEKLNIKGYEVINVFIAKDYELMNDIQDEELAEEFLED
ncbi:MAG: hypothetical protein H0Z24_06735 [Thermosipho sp. (in: Bacteria)]|nr:hypothetical protein [Thermosipho sp. (in: thermotogales)]